MKTILILTTLFFSSLSWGNSSKDHEIPEVPVEFSVQLFEHQSQSYLALSYKNYKEWHTYWKNPGDAGLPIINTFTQKGKTISLKEIEWPIPSKYIEEGDLLAYGYGGSYSLFYQLTPDQKKSFEKTALDISSKWLVCKHVCIPGRIQLSGKIQNNQFQASKLASQGPTASQLLTRFESLPKHIPFPNNLDLVLTKDPKKQAFNLYYNLSLKEALNSQTESHVKKLNLLTAFPQSPFDFGREKLHQDKKGNLYGKYHIQWDGEYSEPPIPFPGQGKFAKPITLKFLLANPLSQKIQVISKTFSSFSLRPDEKMEHFFSLIPPFGQGPKITPKQKTDSQGQQEKSFWSYLLFAFIGGLILNVMPCVLPIISLKLFGLVKHSQASKNVLARASGFNPLVSSPSGRSNPPGKRLLSPGDKSSRTALPSSPPSTSTASSGLPSSIRL